MRSPALRTRGNEYHEDSDEWLIDAARRAGHSIPKGERPPRVSAWRMLIGAGVDDDEILRLACAASGKDPADFSRISPALSALLAHEVAHEHRVAPVGVYKGVLAIATSNPSSIALERELAFACRQRVALQAASPNAILRAQAVVYGGANYGRTLDLDSRPIAGVASSAPAVQPRPQPVARLSVGVSVQCDSDHTAPAPQPSCAAQSGAENKNAPETLISRLLATAVTEHASEAHLQPTPDDGLVIRLRVDGKLNDRFRLAAVHTKALLAALKRMASLDDAETRRPQNGRASVTLEQGPVELRIATEPVGMSHEKVVVSLVTPQSALSVADLGYTAHERHQLEQLLAEPSGLVFIAGTPETGRTTTAYALMRELQSRGRRIATIEEQVGRRLDGIEQMQVADSPHPTLASAVRGTLGLHADVTLIEALADAATMETIVAGASEGRLVVTTIEVPGMTGVIERLHEFEIDHALIASVLKGVVTQRLVRRLCTACAAPQELGELPESQQELLLGLPTSRLRRAVGCPQCRGTGYSGRMAVAEVVIMTPAMRAAIVRGAEPAELAHIAREGGIRTLWDSGLAQVLDGITTLGELLDNVPAPQHSAGADLQQRDIDALLSQLLGSPMEAPAKPAEAAEAAKAPAAVAPPSPVAPVAPKPAVTAAPPSAEPIRVLLVDDDANQRRAVASTLREDGLSVIEAADGEAALSYARRLKPHVIVTEVTLPKLDAVGMLQTLAAGGSCAAVLVYSAQNDAVLEGWLKECGARDVIPRTVPAAAVAQRIRSLAAAS